MIEFEKPNIECVENDENANYGKFVCEPLERGYGMTLGNSLRRVLLSSLPGAAITGIKIDGIQHEFTSIPNIVEDVVEIILNLKSIRFKKHNLEPATITLKYKGAGEITAADIKTGSDLEVINKDQHIATASSGADLSITMTVENGRGYNSSEMNKKEDADINYLPIDSIFTPVKKVNYNVENTRVGNKVDYDKLIIEVWTDGSITPASALSLAATVTMGHLEVFKELSSISDGVNVMLEVEEEKENEILTQPIEDLELTKRPLNCLRIQAISTIGQLVSYTRKEVSEFKNLGKKSLEEIDERLKANEIWYKDEE